MSSRNTVWKRHQRHGNHATELRKRRYSHLICGGWNHFDSESKIPSVYIRRSYLTGRARSVGRTIPGMSLCLSIGVQLCALAASGKHITANARICCSCTMDFVRIFGLTDPYNYVICNRLLYPTMTSTQLNSDRQIWPGIVLFTERFPSGNSVVSRRTESSTRSQNSSTPTYQM
jgi:hypothetical protein